MAWGAKLAYVLRAKGGRNLLIKTNGLPGEAVHDAATNAVTLLAKFAAAQGKQIQDGSGDSPPAFALGRVTVAQGRYTVTYRMVNTILVMVVSEPGANPFTCLNAVDAAAKVLVGACKGVEVTPERIAKRYVEIYAMLGDLLEGGLDALPPGFVHVSATDDKHMALPRSTTDAVRRMRRMLGPNNKGGNKSGEGDALPPVPETPSHHEKRFVQETADPMAEVMFDIPMDALPPPPARAMGARRRPPPPAVPVIVVSPPAFKGAVPDEDLQQSAQEGFGAFQAPELLEAQKDEAVPAGEAATGGAEAEDNVAPSGPVVSSRDVIESVMMIEFWRAEGRGSRIVKAGIEGAVRRRLAPYGLHRIKFKVMPSPTPVVNACLRVAGVNNDTAMKSGDDGSFLAALSGAPMNCSYLKWSLPAVACKPPLLAELIVAPLAKAPRSNEKWQCLVAVQYVASPELAGALLDVSIDVQLPPEVSDIVKVSPAAQWSQDQGKVRWMVPRIQPGAAGVVRAVMSSKAGVTPQRAEEALTQVATARVSFTGWPGSSPSGLSFQVGMADLKVEELDKGRVLWFGDLVLRPAQGK